jgi:hypothetical protein
MHRQPVHKQRQKCQSRLQRSHCLSLLRPLLVTLRLCRLYHCLSLLRPHCLKTLNLRCLCHCRNLLRRRWSSCSLRRLCLCWCHHRHLQLPTNLQEGHHFPRLHQCPICLQRLLPQQRLLPRCLCRRRQSRLKRSHCLSLCRPFRATLRLRCLCLPPSLLRPHLSKTLNLHRLCHRPNILRRHQSTRKLHWLRLCLHRHLQIPMNLQEGHHLPRLHRFAIRLQRFLPQCLPRHRRSQSRLQQSHRLSLRRPLWATLGLCCVCLHPSLLRPHRSKALNLHRLCHCPNLLRCHRSTRKLCPLCLCRCLHRHLRIPTNLQEGHHLPRLHRCPICLQQLLPQCLHRLPTVSVGMYPKLPCSCPSTTPPLWNSLKTRSRHWSWLPYCTAFVNHATRKFVILSFESLLLNNYTSRHGIGRSTKEKEHATTKVYCQTSDV